MNCSPPWLYCGLLPVRSIMGFSQNSFRRSTRSVASVVLPVLCPPSIMITIGCLSLMLMIISFRLVSMISFLSNGVPFSNWYLFLVCSMCAPVAF